MLTDSFSLAGMLTGRGERRGRERCGKKETDELTGEDSCIKCWSQNPELPAPVVLQMRRQEEQSRAACKQNSPDSEKEKKKKQKRGEQEIHSDGSIKSGIYAGRGEKAGLMQGGWLRERY